MNRISYTIVALGMVACSSSVFAQDLLAKHSPDKAVVSKSVVTDSNLSQHNEPNSFLVTSAKSHDRLMSEVKSNPMVMNRFMRHFGKSHDEVVDMFNGLHASELKEDGVYLVYNVPDSGELRARSIYYKRGTPVWVDSMGNLVLKMSCGNPMMRGSDRVGAPGPELQASTALMPVEGHAVGNTEGTPLETLTASAEIPAIAVAPVAATPVSVDAPHMGGGGGFNAAWLLPIAGLAFIHTGGGNDGGNGGGGGGCTNGGNGNGNGNGGVGGGGGTQCVPEPATMAMLAIGAGGLVARKLRKK